MRRAPTAALAALLMLRCAARATPVALSARTVGSKALKRATTAPPVRSHRGAMGARASSTKASAVPEGLSDGCKGAAPEPGMALPLVGTEEIMSQKAHGTTEEAVQEDLRWSCSGQVADRIVSFNRHYAEHAGYWLETSFLTENSIPPEEPITFYDSVTGKPLFRAPIGRSWADFIKESKSHGWPSFRDEEVVWDDVRVLPDGEAVSLAGSHLGHNLPDRSGNRYCINLVSVAGKEKK